MTKAPETAVSISPATREEGLKRLDQFLPHAGKQYAARRNYDLGPGRHHAVSMLSPWIRHRLITEEEVVAAVLKRHSYTAAEKFVQEVFWRTYWKGWLERRPAVWQQYRAKTAAAIDLIDASSDLRSRYEAAISGRTGIEAFDAWASELIGTGFLHNHARMWFASIWIFTLHLPWVLGADFFLRHLLDGDPASNTLSWRWVAGLQTRGKTYLARPNNIERYTEGRFRPIGLATQAIGLEGAIPPAPAPVPSGDAIDPSLPTALLLTEEDLYPETLLPKGLRPVGTMILNAANRRSPLPSANTVIEFTDAALSDAAERISYSPPIRLSTEAKNWMGEADDWAAQLGVRQIVMPYAPVGPAAESSQELEKLLNARGIRTKKIVRPWDARAWVHATRGYFPFREKIPALLAAFGRKDHPGIA
jgi:deoxyribodipyrimidine photo-lyase